MNIFCGLTQAYWSNGIKVSKNLSIGLKGSYIFGNVKNETSVILTNEEKFYTTHYESSTYNDYNLTSLKKLLLQYRLNLWNYL